MSEKQGSVLAVITARGKSKRIPHKNIKDFCGKPILAYSVEAAKNADIFDEIMVSTDDEKIAEIGKAYGAQVPFFEAIKLLMILRQQQMYWRKFFWNIKNGERFIRISAAFTRLLLLLQERN